MLSIMSAKVMGSKFGQTDLSTRASGSMIRQTVREDSYIQMVTYIKEIGLMTRLKASEYTHIWTGQSI
jgi:hypothetical protein